MNKKLLNFNVMAADWMPNNTAWLCPTPPDKVKIKGFEAIKKWLVENSALVINAKEEEVE